MSRRIRAVTALVLALIVLVVATWQGWPWYANAITLLGLCGYALLELYESFAVDPKYIAFVATISAIASVARTAMQAIPGFQPATFFVMMSGFVFGPATGAAVGVFTAVGSNLFLGEGGWTPWQMLAWGLVGCTAGLLRMYKPQVKVLWLIPFGIAWGYVFGWVMNTWSLLGLSSPSVKAYIVLCIQSFYPFDTFHAVANAAFTWVAGAAVFRIFERFRRRLVVTRGDGTPSSPRT